MNTSSAIITLTTDFGLNDSYVGQMKGAILCIAPHAAIVDITHSIAPQNIASAAFLLNTAIDAFPSQTVHIVVVDPGVGSPRHIIAAEAAGHRFVCPDNGVLTTVLQRSESTRAVRVTNQQYFRQHVSDVFHGRDVMGPVAAHWSMGVSLEQFGEPVSDVQLTSIPIPAAQHSIGANGQTVLTGSVIHIDHFGNAITSLHRGDLIPRGHVVLPEHHVTVPLVSHYAQQPQADLIALFGSSQRLELAVPNGNAAKLWGFQIGTIVEWHPLE